jgi:muramidase (phage lysozyme)/beta-lactamase class A
MFEQATALVKMALWPMITSVVGAAAGMFSSSAKAFIGFMTTMKAASELMLTSMGAANAAMDAGIARNKLFAASLGFLGKALTHIGVAFAILMFSKGDFSNPMGDSLKEATKELNNGLTEIRANVQKTADSFDKATNNVKKLGGSLADTLPSKGVQLDIRSFWGGGDFKWDDAIKARNKGQANPVMDVLGVGALGIGGMGAGFAAIKSLSAFVAGLFASVNAMMLPLGSAIPGIIATFATVLANPLTAIVAVLVGFGAAIALATKALDLFAPKLTDKQKEFLNKPENKGIKSYFDTEDPNARLTNAQQQIIKYFEDQDKNIQNLKEFASSQGFTGKPSDFVADIKPLTTEQQQKFNANPDISNLNKQIEDNNNRRLAVLADAKARGASPQEIKDIKNSADFKNLENQSKEMRNAVALAAAEFQIGDSPEVRKTLGDIDGQIAKKQAQLKKLQEESEKVKNINLLALGGEPGASFASSPAYSNEISNVENELKVLEAQKKNQPNLIKASIQRAFDFREIKNIDKQLEAATKRSVELGKALPSDKVRKEQGEVKQLIQQLYKKREDLVNSFGSTLPILERMLKQEEEYKQKLQLGAVEGVTGNLIPAAVQKTQARIDQLKTMIAGVKPFDVRPMEEALYTQATNAVKDANTRFERATSANRIKSNLSQAKIYASSGTAQQIAPELSNIQLADLSSQRTLLTEKINSDQAALDKISQVIVTGGTNLNEAQAEFDKLRGDITKDREALAQNAQEMAKAQRDMKQALIDQTKQVAEYYRASVREAQAVSIEFQKAQKTLEGSRMQNKLREALIGAGDNIYTQFIEGLINIISQTTEMEKRQLDAKKQEIDYQNNIDDIKLRASELQRSLPGKIVPFDENKIKEFDDQLRTVQGSVVGINSDVQEVVKSLGQDAVIATNGLNDASKGLGDTVMGVGTKLDVTLGKLNQVTNENNSSDWAGNLLNTVGRVFGGITSAVSSAITPPTAQDAVATTPATPAPTVTPTVATQFTSPIKNTTIQDLINYKPTFGQSVMGRRPKGRIHNKVDFDSQVKGGAGAEVIASLAGVAKLQKWGGQDAAVFVNSILPSGTQITIEYGHLALNSIKNTLGDLSKPVQVQAGQKLGNVLGHHLDFGVKANGRYINPQVFLANLAKGDYGAIASQPPATAKTKANTVTPANQSKGESVIRMQRLGQKDEFGLEKIQLAVIKQGKIIDRFIVNSGKADTQIFGGAGETKAGSKQPVEFGSYRLGKTTPSGNKAKMGNEFIRLEPDFKTERTAIGFHIDKDRLVDPGSSGCIVFANEAEFNKFKQALKSTGIKGIVFDQAVGAVEIAKNVASQVKPLPKSGNRAFDASNIVSKNKLQSLVVQELSTGRLLGSINSNVSPVSSASTVKLIVADLMTDAINQGTATLQETLTIKPGEVAQWSAINKSGQKRKISELLTQMIVKSDNTAANVLINRLGGLDKLNQLAAAKGYTNTKFNKYFLLPGEDTKKGNVSTAGDVTSAARELLVTNSPSDKLAADALRKTRNFKYQGEVGGKIGNNSKIIGNVGVVSINGKLYLVTAFANTNGNDLTNRKFITNATNDVVKQIQGMQSSELQTIPTQAKPRRKRQPVPILPPVPGTIGIKNSSGISQGGNDLSPEEYAKLTPLGKQLYELRKNKYILALANAVANAEGSDFRKNTKNFGYGLTIGGENVTDFSKHPYVGTGRKPTWIKAINDASTAAGRYQMMDFNASIQAAKKQFGKNAMPDMFKLTDYQGQDQPSFSPGMQDLYFTYSLKSRGVLDQVLAGKVDTSVLNKLAPHYASIQSGKNRSAHPGQGTPQGQHSNFLKTYRENLNRLNELVNTGGTLTPDKMQSSVTDATNLKFNTADGQNAANLMNTEAQELTDRSQQLLGLYRLLRQSTESMFQIQSSMKDTDLDIWKTIREGLSPNMSNVERFLIGYQELIRSLEKKREALEKTVRDTQGVIDNEKLLKAAFVASLEKFPDSPEQALNAINTNNEVFKTTVRQNIQAKKALAELNQNTPKILEARVDQFNKEEISRRTGVTLQTEKLRIGLLQKQVEQRKLLQQLNPLDPRSARTADLEANLALLNTENEYKEKLNAIANEENSRSISSEEAKKRRDLAKEEFELNKQNIELKQKNDRIAENANIPSRLLERAQFIQDSFKGVQESRSSLLKAYGLDFSAEKIDKQLAINNQQMEFAKATLQLDDFIRKNAEATEANKLTNEQINTLRKNLKLTNEAKLDAIKLQFSELGTVVKGVTSSFRGGFKEFLLSTKGFGESVSDLFNSIMKGFLDPLADMASKRMTDALFGWTEGLFGNEKQPTDGINAVTGLADLSVGANGLNLAGMTLNQAGQMLMQAALTISNQSLASTAVDAGGGLLGGVFDVLSGSVFNANSMGFNPTPGLFDGIITDFGSATLPMFADGGIVGVMNKERSITGRKPHLIVASEGERVLNHKETAIWNKLQSGVAGFANGGVVGAGGNGNMASKIGNTTTINVPVSVEVGGDSEVDTYRLSQVVQAMVSDGIRREMRVGGSINRGNPYNR